jgi:DNA-directed RNA polymerase specialized sigma24 family protein
MTTGFVIPVDPAELERFAAPEPPDEDDAKEEEDVLLRPDSVPMAYYLGRLPPREADLVQLYFVDGKRQADLAVMFSVTQAAISYRLARAITRIRFLKSVPVFTEEDIRRDLSEALACVPTSAIFHPWPRSATIDVDILCGIWRTSCQSETAETLGLTQGRVRHRFHRAVATLKNLSEGSEVYRPYYQYFSQVIEQKAFNIVREVKLPQWYRASASSSR